MLNNGNTSLYMDSGPVYCKTEILNHLFGCIQPISGLLQQLRIKPFTPTGWLVIFWELLTVIYVGDVDCSRRLLNTLWLGACPVMAQTVYLNHHNAIEVCMVLVVLNGQNSGAGSTILNCWRMPVTRFCMILPYSLTG